MHNHSCCPSTCEHENLQYCKHCGVAFCKDCGKEWGKNTTWYWPYNYYQQKPTTTQPEWTWPTTIICKGVQTSGNLTVGSTTGISNGIQYSYTSNTTCKHK